MPGPLDGVLVADFSRILAGPYATMLLADLGADVVKVEGPAGDDTRTWTPPVRDGVSTYYLGRQPQQAVDRAGPQGRRRRPGRADAGRSGRRGDRELPPGRADPVRPRLRRRVRDEPGRRLRLDQRLRQRRGGREAAGLRPHRAGDLRTHEPDRRPRRAAVPGRHLGLRRDGRSARDHRDPGRAARPRGVGPGPARRGQPAVLRALRAGEPVERVRRRRTRCPSGWATATRACTPTSRCPAATRT